MRSFNTITPASMGLVIEEVSNLVLPAVDTASVKVPGMPGSYDMQTSVGERLITFKVAYTGDTTALVAAKAHEIAAWLFSTEPRELVLDAEPDRVYFAKFEGPSNMTVLGLLRKGSLTFTCSDPYAYDPTPDTTVLSGDAPVTVTNGGGAETYPTIEATVAEASTFLQVACPDTLEYVLVGTPLPADGGAAANAMTLDFHDTMAEMDWTSSTICIDGSANLATDPVDPMVMVSSGNDFNANGAGGDFGSGAGWHGPTVMRALATPRTNFQIDLSAWLYNAVATMGRQHLYGLDASLNVLFHAGISDSWAHLKQVKVYCYLGATKNYRVYDFTATNKWDDLAPGLLTVKRTSLVSGGSKWSFGITIMGKRNGAHYTGSPHNGASRFDAAGTFDAPLAYVAINNAKFGTYPALERLNASDIKVYGVNAFDAAVPTNILLPGDTVLIDMRPGRVALKSAGADEFSDMSNATDAHGNLIPLSALVDINSTFFALPTGDSAVSISADGAVAGTESHLKRWL